MKKLNIKVQKFFRIISLLFIIGGILFYLFYGKNITIEQIIYYTPQNYFLAIICLLGMYALKSLSVVFPIVILYISSGIIFPLYLAIIVNIVGIAVSLSVPYVIGYFSGNQMANHLIEKYPKLQQMDSFQQNNEWFFVFILRIVGILPMDVVSIFMGSISISYLKYITASIVGMVPNLLVTTFIGVTITDPHSSGFILSCIAKVLITMISILVYKKTVIKRSN